MRARGLASTALILAVLAAVCYVVMRTPMQGLDMRAATASKELDVSGTIDILYLDPVPDGEPCRAVVQFMAVEDTSDRLFTSHGKGPYVDFGCSRLEMEQDFMSFGKFIKIRLSLSAGQSDLKLEDGAPFDITRHSLRPVVMIERRGKDQRAHGYGRTDQPDGQ